MNGSTSEGGAFIRAKNRRINAPGQDTIRLWTVQPLDVWQDLLRDGVLLVDPTHSNFDQEFRAAYDWLREQMAERLPDYAGHYPWWAYEHFLDLRFYRWQFGYFGQRLVRLELAIPRHSVLLSGYGSWHSMLGVGYAAIPPERAGNEQKFDTGNERVEQHEMPVGYDPGDLPWGLYPEPWESRLRANWHKLFDVDTLRETETIQATFERLELSQVTRVTEFTSVQSELPGTVSRDSA